MLTSPDLRTDGRKIAYLQAPDEFREIDASLFDALAKVIDSGVRSVASVQAADILPGAQFHAPLLGDALEARGRYFESFWRTLGPKDLVFFDPDNGLEVASVRKGRRDSAKYLFWDELEQALGEDRGVLVYQHFPRVARAPYVTSLLQRMSVLRPDHEAFAIATPWVAYLLCAPSELCPGLRAAASSVAARPGSPLRMA